MALFDGAECSGVFRLRLTPPPIVYVVCVSCFCLASTAATNQLTNEETSVFQSSGCGHRIISLHLVRIRSELALLACLLGYWDGFARFRVPPPVPPSSVVREMIDFVGRLPFLVRSCVVCVRYCVVVAVDGSLGPGGAVVDPAAVQLTSVPPTSLPSTASPLLCLACRTGVHRSEPLGGASLLLSDEQPVVELVVPLPQRPRSRALDRSFQVLVLHLGRGAVDRGDFPRCDFPRWWR